MSNRRTFVMHPSRHMSLYGAKPKRRPPTPVDVSIIEMLRKHPDDPRSWVLIEELLKLRERSTLPLDVRAILARHDR